MVPRADSRLGLAKMGNYAPQFGKWHVPPQTRRVLKPASAADRTSCRFIPFTYLPSIVSIGTTLAPRLMIAAPLTRSLKTQSAKKGTGQHDAEWMAPSLSPR